MSLTTFGNDVRNHWSPHLAQGPLDKDLDLSIILPQRAAGRASPPSRSNQALEVSQVNSSDLASQERCQGLLDLSGVREERTGQLICISQETLQLETFRLTLLAAHRAALEIYSVLHMYWTLLEIYSALHMYWTLLEIYSALHMYWAVLEIYRVLHMYWTLLEIHSVLNMY